MAAYRRVHDSRHLQADCQEPGSAPEPTLSNRVWASFTYYSGRYADALVGYTVLCLQYLRRFYDQRVSCL